MRTSKSAPKDIDAYIAGFPTDVQQILEKIRKTIRKLAPEAEETISYLIPTFNLKGRYLIILQLTKNILGFILRPAETRDSRKSYLVMREEKER